MFGVDKMNALDFDSGMYQEVLKLMLENIERNNNALNVVQFLQQWLNVFPNAQTESSVSSNWHLPIADDKVKAMRKELTEQGIIKPSTAASHSTFS